MNKNNFEIERLKNLLKERMEEYQVFGKTSEDIEQDNKIIKKIKELKELDE